MKRKVLPAIVLSFIIAVISISGVNAAAISKFAIDVDLNNLIVNINGSSQAANKNIAIFILNPDNQGIGQALSAVDNPSEAVQHQRQVQCDLNGFFTYSFKLHEPSAGVYNIYADGAYVDSFIYSGEAEKRAVLKHILTASESELSQILTDSDTLTAFSIEKFIPVISIDKTKMAGKIKTVIGNEYANVTNANDYVDSLTSEGVITTTGNIQLIIKKTAVVELFNQGFGNNVYNGDLLVYDNYIGVSDLYNYNGVTLYQYYMNKLNVQGKGNVRANLLGNNFANTEELREAFAKAVILNGIKLSNEPDAIGYSHISSLLTAENMTYTGVRTDIAISDAIAKKLVGYSGIYSSIDVLNERIGAYYSEVINSGTGVDDDNGGGGISTSVSIPSNIETPAAVFDDIFGVEWAKVPIETLFKRGIINGVGERTFAPDSSVKREELVKMICKALKIEPIETNGTSFEDVNASHWAAGYISGAIKAGIIKGISEKMFGLDEEITRQDIAVIIFRAIPDKAEVGNVLFSDMVQVADYAQDAVKALSSLKIINGFDDGTFRPDDKCTRAQAATIIYNVLSVTGGLE